MDLNVLTTLASNLVAHVRCSALTELHERLQITILLDPLLILLVLRLHRTETVVNLDVLTTLTSNLVAHVRSIALDLDERLQITILLDLLLILLVLRLHRAETVVDLDVLTTLTSDLPM